MNNDYPVQISETMLEKICPETWPKLRTFVQTHWEHDYQWETDWANAFDYDQEFGDEALDEFITLVETVAKDFKARTGGELQVCTECYDYANLEVLYAYGIWVKNEQALQLEKELGVEF